MYRVLCDDFPIYDPRDEDLTLIGPKLTLELNTAGSFACKIPPDHPQYDLPKEFISKITVYEDDSILFQGRIIKVSLDFYNRKSITCEGDLAFLNDSIQRPAEYHDLSPREYFSKIIEIHNSQVEEFKRFEVGMVTVTNSTDNVYRYTNWESSLKTIKEDLVDDFGGFVRVRYENGHRYLDYIKDYGVRNTQTIAFGENLMDFTRDIDMTDIATVCIPLGARLEESPIKALEARLTVSSVNDGKDYVENAEAVRKWGRIVKTVTWDDVTTPQRLLEHGKKWLQDEQFDAMTLECKAIDLHYVDNSVQSLRLGDMVRIVSVPHGLDKEFPVTKLQISINKVSQNTITFNGTEPAKRSITAKTHGISASLKNLVEEVPEKNAVVSDAIKQASALITSATHGYVTLTDNADELLICDTEDYTKAKKIWRWNLNGLGYSNTGFAGPYATAITMDGQIVGDRLVGNSVDASKLTIDYKTSVTKEIADAEESANSTTDEKLKNYYTKSQVETSISNTKDSILLSAKETATQYVNDRLKNYSTSAQIKLTTDSISSKVDKKVGYSEVISSINQSAERIAIKASKINLEGVVTANKNFMIGADGSMYAKNGTFSGNIRGSEITGSTINIDSGDGCTINLNEYGLRIDATKTSHMFGGAGGRLIFGTQEGILDTMFSPIQFWTSNDKIWNVPLSEGCNKFRFVSQLGSGNNDYLEFQTIYGAFGITAWHSDKKFKKNIEASKIDGISEIKKIKHAAFDWKQGGSHVDCGYIAQDMEACNPQYVLRVSQTDENGRKTGDNLQISEQYIIPVITKALQEVIGKVEVLEDEYSAISHD